MTITEAIMTGIAFSGYVALLIVLVSQKRLSGENFLRAAALASVVFLCLLLAIVKNVPQGAVCGFFAIAGVIVACVLRGGGHKEDGNDPSV